MLWLYLHLPSLLLDHLRNGTNPLALTEGTPPVIRQPDDSARQAGVQAGQSLATARALCPELALVPFSEPQQAEHLERLATGLYQLASPLILWPPDGLLIRADRLQHLYPEPRDLAWVLERYLAQQGVAGRMATGTSPRMARLLARHGAALCTRDAETMHKALRDIPVTAMDWPETVRRKLAHMGLQRLSDLLECCPSELTSRFGPELNQDLERMLGRVREPVREFHPESGFHKHLSLDQETRSTGDLRAPLEHLLQALEAFLRRRQRHCDQLRVTLHHPCHAPTELSLETARCESRAAVFLELALLRLEALVLPDDVQALSLAADRTIIADAPESNDLFGDSDTGHPLQELLHRLRARLGRECIHCPGLRPDPRPERRAHWHTGPEQGSNAFRSDGPVRPFWLQQPPQPLTRPPVHWLNGPERIQGGWWDGDYVRRDYYIALLESGQRAWLFRNRQDQWFIHGWFG